MIHRAVKLRMRVQHHRDRRVLLLGRMITAFEAACRAGENDFRHRDPLMIPWRNQPPLCRSIWLFREMNLSRDKGADQAPLGLGERALGELEAAF
jgi:hypothetical protein